jgi:hypothetical protein
VPRFVSNSLASLDDGYAEPTQLVFRSPEGHAVRPGLFRRRFWNPAVHAAHLAPLRVHDLRHTAVAFWIAAGVTPKTDRDPGGPHERVSVVLDRYGHRFHEQDDALLSALERAASGLAANASPT